jgi:membrane protein DedA with SNARE-associated domain/rhodanese-related sulfurtransferase
MNEVLEYLIRHGYAILFAAVFLEQAGLPVPSVPVLLGVGALSADGPFSFPLALLLAVLASLPADAVWYELGRRRGYGVLRVLCRLSLESETCVSHTTSVFNRYGSKTLLVAKFIPGLNTVAPPLAGLLNMPTARFLLLDGAGAAFWAGAYLGLGFVFRRQLERVAAIVAQTGTSLGVVIVGGFAVYLGWKWFDRQRFLHRLKMARLTPEELWRRMQAGEKITILDLRHRPEIKKGGGVLPGALHFPPAEFEQRHSEVPRDRDVVLYCSCPNEATAATVALRLRSYGITRVSPLAGGFERWRELGYPVDPVGKL